MWGNRQRSRARRLLNDDLSAPADDISGSNRSLFCGADLLPPDPDVVLRWSIFDVTRLPAIQPCSSSRAEVEMLTDLAGFLAGLEGTYQVSAAHLSAAAKLSSGTMLDDEVEDSAAGNAVEPEQRELETGAMITPVRVSTAKLRALAYLLIVLTCCIIAKPVQDSQASSTIDTVAIAAPTSDVAR